MGMFDHVVVLDETLQCPHGHRVHDFQTKSFEDASMSTYLFDGPRVLRTTYREDRPDTAEHWRLEGNDAIFERRHRAELITPPHEVVFYTSCHHCEPVLVRSDHARLWGDLVDERQLWVEFRATFAPGAPRVIERLSGTRDELAAELRDSGLRVLRDDEPLAIAHREIRAARNAAPPPPRRRGRR